MAKNECCSTADPCPSVCVKVDVTKIVKYVAFAGILIIGIIFGTRCFRNMLENGFFDKKFNENK